MIRVLYQVYEINNNYSLLVLISYCNAKELVTTSYSTSETEKYELENGTVHTNIKSSGLWTNN